ncbi:dUTP pyrophosphatase [Cardiosporidium cionae]|uniref:Deoxyuridine 5'-triphosphate nucleotidohydrolase n=1 Tax=Cardiosporidium cionae TaxID=476202 RepID=A0ABQ7JE35_9APIC|nr:dUTP pyrophosphatase [Cardiosporidium cionae]|eukprot:KAF8822134.1 dUTP pyrophosphatase [Cardiosporidium cionae]
MGLLRILPLSSHVRELYAKYEGSVHKGDSGLDLFVVEDQTIQPGETAFVKLGIKVAAYRESNNLVPVSHDENLTHWGDEDRQKNLQPMSWLLMPRSSIAKTPLRLANSMFNQNDEFELEFGQKFHCRLNSISEALYMPQRKKFLCCFKVGLIDAGYRGEVMAAVDNIKSHPHTLRVGDKIVQAVSFGGDALNFELVYTLDTTMRGEGGFGSTNK